MKNISRYILVFIAILSIVVALPSLYWLIFEKPISSPFIMYSCIDDDFMIIENSIRKDLKGNTYTREEFEQKLPLLNMRQLLVSGTMPDTIKGHAIDPHEINGYRSFFRYKPAAWFAPKPGLYPLFESESGRAQLEMPTDFFRIKGRMEFVEASSNKVNEEKTRMFTAVLQKRGFRFPAKMIEGIPTTRKSCDEGYLVIDNNDKLFHIKMIEAKPYVKKVDTPEGLSFKVINCVDFKDKRYYCYMISNNNDLYILTQDEYELQKWDVGTLDPEHEELRIYGDFFNYNVIRKGENFMKNTVLDRNFVKVDEYEQTWPRKYETIQGKCFGFIFPLEINLNDKNSSFTDFYVHFTKGYYWLILNVILMLIHIVIIRKRQVNIKNNYIDLGLIGILGIYGFIAVNIFPNKFYD